MWRARRPSLCLLVFVALQGLDEHLLLVVGELLAQLQVAADDLVLEALDFVGFLVEVVLELVVVFLGGAVVLDGGVALGGESAGQLGLLVDGVVPQRRSKSAAMLFSIWAMSSLVKAAAK